MSIKNCSRSIKLLTQEVFKSLDVSYVKGEKVIEHLSVGIKGFVLHEQINANSHHSWLLPPSNLSDVKERESLETEAGKVHQYYENTHTRWSATASSGIVHSLRRIQGILIFCEKQKRQLNHLGYTGSFCPLQLTVWVELRTTAPVQSCTSTH